MTRLGGGERYGNQPHWQAYTHLHTNWQMYHTQITAHNNRKKSGGRGATETDKLTITQSRDVTSERADIILYYCRILALPACWWWCSGTKWYQGYPTYHHYHIQEELHVKSITHERSQDDTIRINKDEDPNWIWAIVSYQSHVSMILVWH